MVFTKKLIEGRFLKRYKRFFADVEVSGKVVVAHVPNSGSMKSCNTGNSNCYVSYSDDPNRKLNYTLEMIQTPTSWVGVNTQVPNKIVKEALQSWLYQDFELIIPEARINTKSRLDFALAKNLNIDFKKTDLKNDKNKFHFIEVKNVTLVDDGVAMFPDAESTRAQKHLEDLMTLKSWGHSCEILFTIQRTDAKIFKAADHIDPEYSKLLKKAIECGVKVSPYLVELSPKEIVLSKKTIPLDI